MGSEMCIRDSYSLDHAGTHRRGARHLDCCTCGHVLSMLLGFQHSRYVSACSCPMFSGSAIVGHLIPRISALRHVIFIIAHLLTFGAAPGLCKQYTWYHVSILGVVALWTMQRLAVVGPATWTAAHSAEGCAAWYYAPVQVDDAQNTAASSSVVCGQVELLMLYVKRWIGESALLFSAFTCSPHP